MEAESRPAEAARLAAVTSTGLGARPDPAMDRLAAVTARLLGADASLVSLVDDRREFFPGLHGLPDPWADTRETPLSQSICRLVATTGATVQVDDAATDARLVGHDALPVAGMASYLGVPLSDEAGHVLGSLYAIASEARRWTDDDRRLLVDLGSAVSSELRARIATTVAIRATARVQVMADASVALNASLEADDALAGMLDVIVPTLAAWAVVWVRPTPQDDFLALARHTDADTELALQSLSTRELAALTDAPALQELLEGEASLRALTGDEAASALGWIGARGRTGDPGEGGVLVVPVVDGRERLGVLVLGAAPGAGPFSSLDVALATDLGHRAGASLRNARAFDHERSAATTLQHSLLPSLPTVEGLEVCGTYVPAAAGAEVGGDWYDVMAQEDRSVVVTLGDVTGHNMAAAATMGRVTSAIRCYAHDGLSPSGVLGRLDRLRAYILGDLFATCTCLRLRPSPRGWSVTVSNAGHLPPILLPPEGEAQVVEAGRGPLLGPYAAPARQDGHLELPWGGLLLLYSDGLIERRGEGIDNSVERLRQAVGVLDRTAPVDDVCAKVNVDLRPDGSDDVAVLAVRAVRAVQVGR